MNEISPESIMTQVRQNVIYRLCLDAKDNPEHRQQLFELLSKEDIDISDDFLNKTLASTSGKIGFVKVTRPVLDTFNPKPLWRGFRLHAFKIYCKLWVRFFAQGFLIKFIPKILKFEVQTRAFIIADPSDQSASVAQVPQ